MAVWLQRVKEELGSSLVLNWRYFSLEQVNSNKGPDWEIWEQPLDYPGGGLPAFRAAEAARRQGEETFISFHIALFRARHEKHRNIADIDNLVKTAEDAGLDRDRFIKDMNDPRILDALARDHTYAVETLRVFGTPTLVFQENGAVFLRLTPIPSPEESLPIFNEIRAIAKGRPNIKEIKRP